MSSQLILYIVFSVVIHRGLGTVNFALRKSAVQSTTLSAENFLWTAEKAVDGNTNGSNPDNSMTCSATSLNTSAIHTWEVSIGFQIIVKTVTVYGRTDRYFDQLRGFKLYIGNESRSWIYNQELQSSSSNDTIYVFKPNDVIASFISLIKFGELLVVCEVTVDGECLSGNYSKSCNLTCGACYAYQPCDKENGTCPMGCDQGWTGSLCKEGCRRGAYGYNCNKTCGNCLPGNSSCSPTDGNCTNGCIAGWQGYHCNIGCNPGKYGFNCNETCGNCLYGNTSCNTSYGYCNDGCQAGWQGDDCKTGCNTGEYGYNCNETCGNCLNSNISCDTLYGNCNNGCMAGWQGYDCKKECNAGTYGFTCSETCGYCLYGNNSCLHVYGQCPDGCQSGWKGETCKSGCERGNYSYNCNETCGHCLYGNSNCSTSDGNCTNGCLAGWQGYQCNIGCDRGTFGYKCNETCGHCLNGNSNCSTSDGNCTNGCLAGWQGYQCNIDCERGHYGYNCNETCGHCLYGNSNCSTTDGNCSNGCIAGWHGYQCKPGTLGIVNPDEAGPNGGVIAGSVLAALGVCIFAMAIIIVIVKNKRKNNKKETSTEHVTPAEHYANLVVGSPNAACTINDLSRAEKDTTFSAIEETRRQGGLPIRATNCHSWVMEPDVPAYKEYEKLRYVPESTESTYYTIDHTHIDDQIMESMKNCSTFVETLHGLENALKSVEKEISVLLSKKETLFSNELKGARTTHLGDKLKGKDSHKDKDITIVNYVQMLQSVENEVRIFEEKRKCLLGRKEILLREELAKTTESEK